MLNTFSSTVGITILLTTFLLFIESGRTWKSLTVTKGLFWTFSEIYLVKIVTSFILYLKVFF